MYIAGELLKYLIYVPQWMLWQQSCGELTGKCPTKRTLDLVTIKICRLQFKHKFTFKLRQISCFLWAIVSIFWCENDRKVLPRSASARNNICWVKKIALRCFLGLYVRYGKLFYIHQRLEPSRGPGFHWPHSLYNLLPVCQSLIQVAFTNFNWWQIM